MGVNSTISLCLCNDIDNFVWQCSKNAFCISSALLSVSEEVRSKCLLSPVDSAPTLADRMDVFSSPHPSFMNELGATANDPGLRSSLPGAVSGSFSDVDSLPAYQENSIEMLLSKALSWMVDVCGTKHYR